jgi:putative FmdB family regulatory protein
MPTYDFQCECGNEWEEDLPIKDHDKEIKCPKCGKKAKRVYSKFSVNWKEKPTR